MGERGNSVNSGFFYPEDGGDTFFRNVGSYKTYAAPHPRGRHSLPVAIPTTGIKIIK
jgi:hypothetical protein